MKKIISLILVIALSLCSMPMTAYAASDEEITAYSPYSENASLIEIVREGAPIRTGPGENYSKVVKCTSGAVLEKLGTTINRHLNKWYKVTYCDSVNNVCYTGWIYSENVQKHSHVYEKLSYDGVTYKYCDCGKITVLVKGEQRVQKANALAIAGTAAGTLSVSDAFLPVGDVIGLGLLITVGLLSQTGVIPDTNEVIDVYEDIDFNNLNDGDYCPIDSYRRVSRAGGGLSYLDDECLSLVEAFVWVRTGNDVWCYGMDTAYKLASLYPDGCFSEIDSGNKDYWYHFHLGTCNSKGKHIKVVGGHVFYGTSAITGSLPK